MFKWLFGRKEPQGPRSAEPNAADRFTPAIDDAIRDAAPIDAEAAERLAQQFGPSFTAASVRARTVRLGVPYIRKDARSDPSRPPTTSLNSPPRTVSSASRSRPAPAQPSAETVYLGVYCTELRYDEDDHGASLPPDFDKAKRAWTRSNNDPQNPHYRTACELLSKWYVSEFSMVDAAMTMSFEMNAGGSPQQTEDKYLSPADSIKSAFVGKPRLRSIEVVAVDFRQDPAAAPHDSQDPLLRSPDVALLAIYEAKINPKLGSSDLLPEWLNFNTDLVVRCFSLELKPDVLEHTDVDDDGDEITFSGSTWEGGVISIAVATGTEVQAREELTSRVRHERAALFQEGEAASPIERMIFLGDASGVREQLSNGLDVAKPVDGEPLLKLALIALFAAESRFTSDDDAEEIGRHFTSLAAYKDALRKVVFTLLEGGADVNQPAGKISIPTIAEALKDPEITPAIRARSGREGDGLALIIAAETGDVERVRDLLDHDADVDTGVFKGTTPLMIAAQGPGGEGGPALSDEQRVAQEETVKLLLERGADVNAVAHDGNTALGNAVRRGNKTIAKMLLDAGAKTKGALPGGQSITELARKKNNADPRGV